MYLTWKAKTTYVHKIFIKETHGKQSLVRKIRYSTCKFSSHLQYI